MSRSVRPTPGGRGATMGGAEEQGAVDFAGWMREAQWRTVDEFVARYPCLFFLVHEGGHEKGPWGFETDDFEATIAKMVAGPRDQAKVRVLPIVKSPRN